MTFTGLTMFWEYMGIGLGIGIVHSVALLGMLVLARINAARREDETIGLMKERNELDRKKVDALKSICWVRPTDEDVERFIGQLPWSDSATNDDKTITAGNIRNFWKWLKGYQPDSEPSQEAYDELYSEVIHLRPENVILKDLLRSSIHLIKAATGPEDGPTSWNETRDRWMELVEDAIG